MSDIPSGAPGTSWRTVARLRAGALTAESRNDRPPRSTVSGSMSSWPQFALTVPGALRVRPRPTMPAAEPPFVIRNSSALTKGVRW